MAGVRAQWGFLALAAASAAWVVSSFTVDLIRGNAGDWKAWLVVIGFAAMTAGFTLAAWAAPASNERAVGLATVFAGILPFFFNGFVPIQISKYFVAIVFFMCGLAGLLAFALAQASDFGTYELHEWVLRGSALTGLVAPLVWIPLDLDGGAWWIPGDILSLVGLGLLVVSQED